MKKLFRTILLLLAAITLMAPPQNIVQALDEQFTIGNDIFYYNPEDTCAPADSSDTISTAGTGADIKVTLAQANVVTPSKHSVPQRTRFVGTMEKFSPHKPDFVTLNEIAPSTDVSYKEYKAVKEDYPKAKTTEDTGVRISFNSDKWKKVESGIEQIHQFEVANNSGRKDRYALWGTFQNIENGGIISVIATHYNTRATYAPNINRAKVQSQNLKALADTLLPKGPVLIGGDFNFQLSHAGDSHSPATILAGSDLKPAIKKGEGSYVDWIFYSSQLKNTSKKVYPTDRSLSDHPYLVASFEGSSEAATNIKSGASCSCSESSDTGIAGPSDLDSFLKALAMQESGGNPKAANPGSSARGKYQYITSTWQSRWAMYPPAKSYATADKAPEEVQDALVYIEYAQKWKEFNGDLFKLAISHFYPAANSDPSLLDQHIGPSSNPTPREYANGVVDKIKNGYGSKIKLYYDKAPDFDKYLTKAVGGGVDFSGTGGGTSSESSCGDSTGNEAVDEGGLTEEQAKKFVINYGANKKGDSAKFAGALWPFCEGGGANCVTFSYFFNNKFTNLPAGTSDGNGEAIVGSLKAKGAKTGNKPKVFSTFSWDNGGYGHTGIVLGIHGNTAIVGHASCSNGSPGAGDGVTLGKGAAIVRVGKLNDPYTWLGKVPNEFAYPDSVKVSQIESYINGKI